MPIIRTPEERFLNLPDYAFAPHYLQVTANEQEVRMHYVDEGQGQTILCLHGEPSWSFLYRHIIHELTPHYRLIAPDLIGFGKSDKFTELDEYTIAMHYSTLVQFIEKLDLKNITLVCQDWGGILGLTIATHFPERFDRLVIMNTGLPTADAPAPEGLLAWLNFAKTTGREMMVGYLFQLSTVPAHKLSEAVVQGYDAPFPDAQYKAGVAKFPLLVPINPEQEGVPMFRAAKEALKEWHKPALVMFSDGDPVTKGGDKWFRKFVPGAHNQPEIVIEGAGHFLQEEQGQKIAQEIHAFMIRTKNSPSA
jgi:haloalkane dehalogenase